MESECVITALWWFVLHSNLHPTEHALRYVGLHTSLKQGGDRLDKLMRNFVCLAFVVGVICYVRRLVGFGPSSSASDNHKRMYVFHSFCLQVGSSNFSVVPEPISNDP